MEISPKFKVDEEVCFAYLPIISYVAPSFDAAGSYNIKIWKGVIHDIYGVVTIVTIKGEKVDSNKVFYRLLCKTGFRKGEMFVVPEPLVGKTPEELRETILEIKV